MNSYVLWRLDPALSPVLSLPPVGTDKATAQSTLERAARQRKRSAEGSSAGVE